MGKIVAGVSILVLSWGIANAEEFLAQISKVEGSKITAKVVKFDKDSFKKGGGFGKDAFKDAETKTFTLTTDVKVTKRGKFNKDTGKAESTPLEEGLKNKMFSDATEEKPVAGRIITNDKGEVTEISVGGKGGKKKKNDTSY
jgi:hypothetical protein